MSWTAPVLAGTASLAEDLDKKLLVLLRDGRKLIGSLCCFDQYANVVLKDGIERLIVGNHFCDIPLGSIYVIRGENVILIGALDEEREELPPHMMAVSQSAILQAQKEEKESSELKGTMRKRMEFLDIE
eukprot:TRINITY_DN1474_c0_g1_i1.p1 TRINITY_DN1474_c0_g1~~TRINITY_DN1474_c0_g1_i1.p1  ORF type:complete len:129 (+),score=31.82 TRINITY_DN1474_c0_g1_i1:77-463(+)